MRERRRRRGGELSPQLMSLNLSVMAAEGEGEEGRQGAGRIDWCLLLKNPLDQWQSMEYYVHY